MIKKSIYMSAVVLGLLLSVSGCGEDKEETPADEFSLVLTQRTDGDLFFNYKILQDDTAGVLQLSPSVNPPVGGDDNLSVDGSNGTRTYSDYFNTIEELTNRRVSLSERTSIIESNELYKNSPVLSVDVLITNRSIDCNRTTDLNSTSDDINYTCVNTNTNISNESPVATKTTEQITLKKSEKYYVLYRSVNLQTTQTKYQIVNGNVTEK